MVVCGVAWISDGVQHYCLFTLHFKNVNAICEVGVPVRSGCGQYWWGRPVRPLLGPRRRILLCWSAPMPAHCVYRQGEGQVATSATLLGGLLRGSKVVGGVG